MSKLLKLLERARNSPTTVSFEEMDKLLLRAGFKKRHPRSGSSHYTYTKDGKLVTVVKDQPHIKEKYVELALEAVGDYFEE